MPYRRKSTRAPRKRRVPYAKRKNATERVVKASKFRKSARAQSKQIRTIARATTHIQRQLKDNQNVDMFWNIAWSNRTCATRQLSTLGNIVVLPLTSGPTGNTPTNGAISNLPFLNQDPNVKDMAWECIQPKGRSVQDGRSAPPWCKLFRQNVKMCFHTNNLRSQVRYTMYVIRIARPEDGSQLDNTMLQRLQQIDGVTGLGHPSVASDFANEEDYYCIPGFVNPQLTPASATFAGTPSPEGCLLPRMNYQRWKVIHRREFVLGPAIGTTIPTTATPQSMAVQTITQPGATSPDNTSFYACDFNINYGGAILKPANIDASATAGDPQTLNDLSYEDINPKLKHWVVLFPSNRVQESDPPAPAYQQGVPVISLQSTISTKVPA